MSEKLSILNQISEGGFVRISDTNYKSLNADAVVVCRAELEELLQERIVEEIPFFDNKFLKSFIPKKYRSEQILDHYKELSKYPTEGDMLLFGIIKNHSDLDHFYHDALDYLIKNDIGVAELILPDSIIKYTDDKYTVFISETE